MSIAMLTLKLEYNTYWKNAVDRVVKLNPRKKLLYKHVWYLFHPTMCLTNLGVGPYQVSNSPSDIVKCLVQPIKGRGGNITTDNWYTSDQLATELLDPSYKLTLVGTL